MVLSGRVKRLERIARGFMRRRPGCEPDPEFAEAFTHAMACCPEAAEDLQRAMAAFREAHPELDTEALVTHPALREAVGPALDRLLAADPDFEAFLCRRERDTGRAE